VTGSRRVLRIDVGHGYAGVDDAVGDGRLDDRGKPVRGSGVPAAAGDERLGLDRQVLEDDTGASCLRATWRTASAAASNCRRNRRQVRQTTSPSVSLVLSRSVRACVRRGRTRCGCGGPAHRRRRPPRRDSRRRSRRSPGAWSRRRRRPGVIVASSVASPGLERGLCRRNPLVRAATHRFPPGRRRDTRVGRRPRRVGGRSSPTGRRPGRRARARPTTPRRRPARRTPRGRAGPC